MFGSSRGSVMATFDANKLQLEHVDHAVQAGFLLGDELRKTIRTGSRCMFVPSDVIPARWVLPARQDRS